jgi:hypothetical protein
MNDQQFQDAILRRFDILIALQLDNSSAESIATSSKIDRLLAAGATPAETAKIIGKPVNYVTAVMATKNKRSESTRKRKIAAK